MPFLNPEVDRGLEPRIEHEKLRELVPDHASAFERRDVLIVSEQLAHAVRCFVVGHACVGVSLESVDRIRFLEMIEHERRRRPIEAVRDVLIDLLERIYLRARARRAP